MQMPFSPVSHAIALGLLAWLYLAFRRAAPERSGAAALVVGVLFAWVGVSSALAWRGAYLAHNDWLLLWLGTAMPFVLLGGLSVCPPVRALLAAFVASTPPASLALVHTPRVLGIGTLIKWWGGALPGHFILPVAVPDMLIGLTAPLVARGGVAGGWRVAWHAVGAGCLLIAPVLIELSQPGPLHVFAEGPNTDEVLSFPMSIVPTFVAPMFLGLHLAALVRLRRSAV